jgi:hypothetical protein
MHLSKRKGGALFTVLGCLMVAEGIGVFGTAGPAIQVIFGLVFVTIGAWFYREWWRSHKRVYRRD